jgi:hypothetical protein
MLLVTTVRAEAASLPSAMVLAVGTELPMTVVCRAVSSRHVAGEGRCARHPTPVKARAISGTSEIAVRAGMQPAVRHAGDAILWMAARLGGHGDEIRPDRQVPTYTKRDVSELTNDPCR